MTLLLLIALAVCAANMVAYWAGVQFLSNWIVKHGCPKPSKNEWKEGCLDAIADYFSGKLTGDERKE